MGADRCRICFALLHFYYTLCRCFVHSLVHTHTVLLPVYYSLFISTNGVMCRRCVGDDEALLLMATVLHKK